MRFIGSNVTDYLVEKKPHMIDGISSGKIFNIYQLKNCITFIYVTFKDIKSNVFEGGRCSRASGDQKSVP